MRTPHVTYGGLEEVWQYRNPTHMRQVCKFVSTERAPRLCAHSSARIAHWRRRVAVLSCVLLWLGTRRKTTHLCKRAACGAGGTVPAWLPALLQALLGRERHHKCISGAMHLLALAAALPPGQRALPGAPALGDPGSTSQADSSGAGVASAAAAVGGAAVAPGAGSAAPPAGWRGLLEQLEGARHADVRVRALLGLGAALPPLVAALRRARPSPEAGATPGSDSAEEGAAAGMPAGRAAHRRHVDLEQGYAGGVRRIYGRGEACAAEEAGAGEPALRTDSHGMCGGRPPAHGIQGRETAQTASAGDAPWAPAAGLRGGTCGQAARRAGACDEDSGSGSRPGTGGRSLPCDRLHAGDAELADAGAAVAALLRAARRCGEPAMPREVRGAATGALAASGLLLELPAPAGERPTGRCASAACASIEGATAAATGPGDVTGLVDGGGRAGALGRGRVSEEAAVEAWAMMLTLMEDEEEEVRAFAPLSICAGSNEPGGRHNTGGAEPVG